MTEIWIYRALITLAVSIITFGLVRWIKSMDRLTEAVNSIRVYMSSQDERTKHQEESIKALKLSNTDFYKRFAKLDIELAKIKTQITNCPTNRK